MRPEHAAMNVYLLHYAYFAHTLGILNTAIMITLKRNAASNEVTFKAKKNW